MTVRILRLATGCVAAVSVGLLAGGMALSYADRHLMPVSGWDFSNVFEEVTFMVVPAVGYVLATRQPGTRSAGCAWVRAWCWARAFLLLVRAARAGRRSWVAAGGPGGRVVLELGLADDSGCGIGVHSPAVPDRAAGLAAMAPGRVVRHRGVHAGSGGPGGTRLPGLGGPVRRARCRVVSVAAYRDLVLVPAALLAGGAAVAVRFARSSGEERLQLKWFAMAALLVVGRSSRSRWPRRSG